MRAAVLLLAAVLAPAGARGQQAAPSPSPSPAAEQPVFAGQVDLVTVDVVATGKDGLPVSGLKREDFTLLDEGRPQTISSFEAVNRPGPERAGAPRRQPVVSTNQLPDRRTSRSFMIVFDDNHLSPQNALRAKAAVATFLDRALRDGDHVTLVSTGGGTWWSTEMQGGREDLLAVLKGLDGRRIPSSVHDRVSDYEAMRIHLYQDTLVGSRVLRRFEALGLNIPDLRAQTWQAREERQRTMLPGVNDMLVEARAAEAYRMVRSRSLVTLTTLERAVRALSAAQGRKALLLVSAGFVMDTSVDGFKKVTEAARRANVALYFLDTRGLQGLSRAYSAEFGPPIDEGDIGAALADTTQEAAGAEHLAGDTGGFTVRNTNDLTSGVERIARESRAYYLLGYQPPPGPRDGRYRRIQVNVARRGVRIRARRGYFAPGEQPLAATTAAVVPPPPPRHEKDRDIQEALDAPFPLDRIPLRMTAYVLGETLLGRARVLLATDIDMASLDLLPRDGRLTDALDVLLVAAQRETGEFFRVDQKLEVALRPETLERMRATWYTFVREFELAPGGYQAKIVVRSQAGRRLGTVTHQFLVPPLDRLRVSTPIITDLVEQPQGQAGVAPVVVARRSFGAGGALFCQFDVYGAQPHTGSRMPRVSAGYELRRSDGGVARHVESTPIEPTSLGKVSRLLAIGLGDLGPGEYELVLKVRDEVASREIELREPFRLAGAPQAAR